MIMSNLKLLFATLASASLVACGGGGGGSSTPSGIRTVSNTPSVNYCDGSGTYTQTNVNFIPGYLITDDTWGLSSVTSHWQTCVSGTANSSAASSTYTWDLSQIPTTDVVAYPSVVYWPSSYHMNGVNLNQLNTLSSTYNYSYTGQVNDVSYDMWIDTTSSFQAANHKGEVMIWMTNGSVSGVTAAQLSTYPIVTIAGTNYYLWTSVWSSSSCPASNCTHYNFIAVNPSLSGTIQLQPFYTYLLTLGFLSNSDYLTDIEFGAELREQTTGSLTINNFSVNP
jgi:hypothetical protein